MTQMKNEKINKRAAALRDNLKRRKAKAKIQKKHKKHSIEEIKDGNPQSE